jgi:tetratricopeptide (TPR) repeat protein
MNRFCLYRISTLIVVLSFFVACNSGDKKNSDVKTDTFTETNDTTQILNNLSDKIRENPRNHELFYKRAQIQYASNNIAEAVNDMEIALKLDSLNANYLNTLSEYYLSMGKSGKALDALLKCVKYHPNDRTAHYNLAQIYFYVEQYNDALSEINIIENQNKQNADTYFLKALIYKENGDNNTAIKNLRKTLEYNSEHWEAYNLLGLTYYEMDNPLAIEYFNTAVRLFPDNLEIGLNSAIILQKFEKINESIFQYKTVIEKFPESFNARFNLGYVYLVFTEDYNLAVEQFTAAIDIDSLSGEAYYNRAYAYELMGELDSATEDYYKSLEIIPNYDLAIEGLNSIDNKRFR